MKVLIEQETESLTCSADYFEGGLVFGKVVDVNLGVVKELPKGLGLSMGQKSMVIAREVARHFEVPWERMASRDRPARLAFARQVAMVLCRRMLAASLVQVGQFFGGRDHGTVIHAEKRVRAEVETRKGFKETMEKLEQRCLVACYEERRLL